MVQKHVNGWRINVLIKNVMITLLNTQINNNASIGYNIATVMDRNVLTNYKIVINIVILVDVMDG